MQEYEKPRIKLGNHLLWFSYETGATYFVYKGCACVRYDGLTIALSFKEDGMIDVVKRPERLQGLGERVYELVIPTKKEIDGIEYFDLLKSIFGIEKLACIFGPTIALPLWAYKKLRNEGQVILDREFRQIEVIGKDCYEFFKGNGRFYVRTYDRGIGSPRLECMIQILEESNSEE